MKEVKLLNEELKEHQKIDYDIKAGQVAIALNDLFVLIFWHKHSNMTIKQTSNPCSFIRWKDISKTTKNFIWDWATWSKTMLAVSLEKLK